MVAVQSPISLDQFPLDRRNQAWAERLAEIALMPEPAGEAAVGVAQFFPSNSGAVLASLGGERQRLRGVTAIGSGNLLVLLLRQGRAAIHTVCSTLHMAEGDLTVIDAGAMFELDCQGDWQAMVLLLPATPLAVRLGRNRAGYPLALGSTVAAMTVRAVLRSLAINLDTIGQADLSAGEVAVTELLASAILGELKAPDGNLTAVQAAHFRRVAAAIDRRLAEPDLQSADIARQEGMSTRYLQRLFERRAESFSEYLRAQRLEHCRMDLLDPNHDSDSIAAIGLRWGFRDQAHFSRAFTAAFGLNPTELRRSRAADQPDYDLRGRPSVRVPQPRPMPKAARAVQEAPLPDRTTQAEGRHHLPATNRTVHWGYLSRTLPPVLRINPGEIVTIETLTQHAGDDWERMVAGDAGAESVFEWTAEHKAVDRRGAGPANASVFGRGAGEGFGVHICTGPIHVAGAEPGDVLEVEILDIRPRPSGNPAHAGKAFASNVSAWWGYQYKDMLDPSDRHETVTIFEIDLKAPATARPLYSYRWKPQTDPYGVVHATLDYPGVRVDHATVTHEEGILGAVAVPARMHFGFVAVAPREADFVDSIPPGPFGGNIDNWRAGKGTRLYLPVQVEGALLSVGDGHFAQSDGEINGTGLECSLTGDLRISLHKARREPPFLRGLKGPIIETADAFVIQSFSYSNYLRELGSSAQSEVYRKSTVDLAMRNAFRQARRFLIDAYGFTEDEALTLMSLCVDFGITQVADGNFGAHAIIRKSVLAGRIGVRG